MTYLLRRTYNGFLDSLEFTSRKLGRVYDYIIDIKNSRIGKSVQRENDSDNPRAFRRGIPATVLGLFHVTLGFLNTMMALVRIGIIGWEEPFRFSRFLGVFNLTYEALPLLLWISGVGILRSKRWGYYTGMAWAGLTLIFHISAYFIRLYYWGDLAAAPGWGEVLVMYYAAGFTGLTLYMILRRPR